MFKRIYRLRPSILGRCFGDVNREPDERVTSVSYYALINIDDYDRQRVGKHDGQRTGINDLSPLLSDHLQMVEQARELMKKEAP